MSNYLRKSVTKWRREDEMRVHGRSPWKPMENCIKDSGIVPVVAVICSICFLARARY